jgi:hypothetical protein
VIGEPPLLAGAENDTVADASALVAVTAVGAPGTSARVTAGDAADSALSPAAFVARTVKVYAVPFVSDDTTHGLVAHIALPFGAPVTTYPVIADPPLLAGATKATDAALFPRVATTLVGTPATVDGVTAGDAADSKLSPTEFVACTVNVYAVPLVSDVTRHGLAVQLTEPLGVPVTT